MQNAINGSRPDVVVGIEKRNAARRSAVPKPDIFWVEKMRPEGKIDVFKI